MSEDVTRDTNRLRDLFSVAVGWQDAAQKVAVGVRELHKPKAAADRDGGAYYCVHCRRDWPCPTFALVEDIPLRGYPPLPDDHKRVPDTRQGAGGEA